MAGSAGSRHGRAADDPARVVAVAGRAGAARGMVTLARVILGNWAPPPLPARPARRLARRGYAAGCAPGRGARGRAAAWKFTLRLTLCTGVAAVLSEVLPLQRSYWLVLTVGIILKPDYGSVFARALQRGIGRWWGRCSARRSSRSCRTGRGYWCPSACSRRCCRTPRRGTSGCRRRSSRRWSCCSSTCSSRPAGSWPRPVSSTPCSPRGGAARGVRAVAVGVAGAPARAVRRGGAGGLRLHGRGAGAAAGRPGGRPGGRRGPPAGCPRGRRGCGGGHSARCPNMRTEFQRTMSEPTAVSRRASAWWPAAGGLEEVMDAVTATAVALGRGAAPPSPASVHQLTGALRAVADAIESDTMPRPAGPMPGRSAARAGDRRGPFGAVDADARRRRCRPGRAGRARAR